LARDGPAEYLAAGPAVPPLAEANRFPLSESVGLPHSPDVPLCVDLDESLVRTDTLAESALALIRSSPVNGLRLLYWAWGGRARLKVRVAEACTLDASLLPYNDEVLAFLRAERRAGRRLILTTGAAHSVAEGVARHLGLFDEVVATTVDRNLTGRVKGEVLRERYGEGFDYLGNAAADVPVWRHARRALVVGAPMFLRRLSARGITPARAFGGGKWSLRVVIRGLRVQQWAKNLLLFVPLLTSHKIFSDPPAVLAAGVAFLAFSLCASGVYLVNDVLDLEHDRKHPTKRHRPLAAGLMSIRAAGLWTTGLLLAAGLAASQLPRAFAAILAIYFVTTFAYSMALKQRPVLDVLCLAGLYTLRIGAGAAAIGVPVSRWLLAFSIFLFLSLALVKRISELRLTRGAEGGRLHGRGYLGSDLDLLSGMGSASAYTAVLTLALYVTSPEVSRLYTRPDFLWAICPCFLYWLTRILLLARRGEITDDPVVFAIKDPASYAVLALTVLFTVVAI
jgi:4-hydroxybenzoate polyprenyltransferase